MKEFTYFRESDRCLHITKVHRCFGLSRSFLSPCFYTVHISKNEYEKKKLHLFLCFWLFFWYWGERKPLIKTFLVCGILLLGPEVENSFLHILQNLLPISLSLSLLLLEICFTDVFVPLFFDRFFRAFGIYFFPSSTSRDFVQNLLINIFCCCSCCCLSAHQPNMRFTCFEAWVSRKFGLFTEININFPFSLFVSSFRHELLCNPFLARNSLKFKLFVVKS